VKRVAEALGVSRPHLATTTRHQPRPRGPYDPKGDDDVLARARVVIDERASYGYRRVTARLNCEPDRPRINHKRVYRIMKRAGLMLRKHGSQPERRHEGKVVTLASDLRCGRV